MTCGPVGSESPMFSVADRGPDAPGVKVTPSTQLPAGGIVPELPVPQLLLTSLKSEMFVPWILAVNGNPTVPTFLTVTVLTLLTTPTTWLPKVNIAGVTWTTVPKPLN